MELSVEKFTVLNDGGSHMPKIYINPTGFGGFHACAPHAPQFKLPGKHWDFLDSTTSIIITPQAPVVVPFRFEIHGKGQGNRYMVMKHLVPLHPPTKALMNPDSWWGSLGGIATISMII